MIDSLNVAPFRMTSPVGKFDVHVEGNIPTGLQGRLIRTTPAGQIRETWKAHHWFDGLCMLYSFNLSSSPSFNSAWLDSDYSRQTEKGKVSMISFGTPANTGFIDWISHPIPLITDNCNVNVMRNGDDYLTLTESSQTLKFNPATLQTLGDFPYGGKISSNALGLAHPRFHQQRGEILTLCTNFGLKTKVDVTSITPGSNQRERLNTWVTPKWPYIHDFGLTEHYAIIIAHPFSLSGASLLWSKKGISQHIQYQPDEGMKLIVLPLDGSTEKVFETDPGFVYHLFNSFEHNGEIIMDVVEHQGDDAITKMSIDNLKNEMPVLGGTPTRLRLDMKKSKVIREVLADKICEFPQINYARVHQCNYQYGYGASITTSGDRSAKQYNSRLLKIDTRGGNVLSYGEDDWIPGEPIFAENRKATEEEDGYLLTVASHRTEDKSQLWILNAKDLQPEAKLTVNALVPLGFHGQFFHS
jgi:carotenoid cleavage dioxygenase-like enzyme